MIANMHLYRETFLLFSLNLLDALLTIIWVRNGVAPESNHLMASLLDNGNFVFLLAKIGMGAITALVILRWGNRPLARYGMALALTVYIGVMGVHFFTGLAAFGYVSNFLFENLSSVSDQFFAFFVP